MDTENNKFYILYENAVYGPYTPEETISFITPQTLVCREGEEVWHTAADVNEFKEVLEKHLQEKRYSEENAIPGSAYYVLINKKEYGPYSIEQLKEFITPNTLTRKSDSDKWVKAISIAELSDYFEHPEGPVIKDWFYKDLENTEHGPYSKPELERLIKERIITEEMSVKHLNWQNYRIAKTTKLFTDVIKEIAAEIKPKDRETKLTKFLKFRAESKTYKYSLFGILIILWLFIIYSLYKNYIQPPQEQILQNEFIESSEGIKKTQSPENEIDFQKLFENPATINIVDRPEIFQLQNNIANLFKDNFFYTVVMDVGQGDAILIRSPNKKYYLIDAGANSQNILAYLNRLGVKEIEIFFITHPHHDHIGGALDILKNFRVKKFYDSGYPHTSSTYKKILYEIKAQNISYNLAVAGNTINIDNNLKIEILHPDKPNYKNINDNSIVCKFIYKNTSILLTGDAEHTANEVMIKTFGKKIKSDILKTGHHGSRTATDQFFLDYVKPNIAVISCGVSNRYKHPHKEVLELLEKNHIKLYRTDLDGFVILESDGSKWNVTVDKTSIYDIVEEPLKNLKPKYSINFENYEALIKSKKWKKFGDESQFDNSDNALVISANAGEQIYSNNLTCPALVTLPPNEDKWVSVIKMIGSASRNTDGAIALINNSVNWLTFSSANEGKTISINYTKNGKITSDYFKLKFAPLFFAIERYGNRLNFAVSEDNKNWTILKRYDIIDIGIDINKSKLCLTSNAWRKEPATSWFFEYEEY